MPCVQPAKSTMLTHNQAAIGRTTACKQGMTCRLIAMANLWQTFPLTINRNTEGEFFVLG